MIGFLISLLILVLIAGLCYWIIGLMPIPQPFKNVVLVIFLLICLIYLLGMLAGAVPPIYPFRVYR